MLSHNTVKICFIHVYRQNNQNHFNYHYPLSKPYDFYLDDHVKKHLDIGSVIEYRNPDYLNKTDRPYLYGVVVDNFTTRNASDLYQPITTYYQTGHLRSFLTETFKYPHDGRSATTIYHAFRNASRPYWQRLYNSQHPKEDSAK